MAEMDGGDGLMAAARRSWASTNGIPTTPRNSMPAEGSQLCRGLYLELKVIGRGNASTSVPGQYSEERLGYKPSAITPRRKLC